MKKTILIFAILTALFNLTSCTEAKEENNIDTKLEVLTAKDYYNLIVETEEPQIIDVRTPQEFSSGNIDGAININIYDNNFNNKVTELDKDRPVFVYCRSGSRSNKASNILTEMGFTKVYDLKGGITSWNLLNLSLPADNSMNSKSSSGLTIEAYNKIITNNEKLVLVDFNAEWCAPCKKLSPILDRIAEENSQKVELVKLDVDENPIISKSMRIQGLPTLKLYKNGIEVWQYLGLTNEERILQQINSNI